MCLFVNILLGVIIIILVDIMIVFASVDTLAAVFMKMRTSFCDIPHELGGEMYFSSTVDRPFVRSERREGGKATQTAFAYFDSD